MLKVHLLFPDRDPEQSTAESPEASDLEADLGLEDLFAAMGQGDKFLADVARRVILQSLVDERGVRYRQKVLQDCLDCSEGFQAMYSLAVAAIDGERRIWSLASRRPASSLRRATQALELFLPLLRQLRAAADTSMAALPSPGVRQLVSTLQSELDDPYLAALQGCLQALRRLGGEQSISARLGPGNQGLDYVLRSPSRARPGWGERLGLGERSQYSFQIAPRDEAGFRALADLVDRGLNSAADAVAQAADHVLSFFQALRFELGFYLGCRNLHRTLSEAGSEACWPAPLLGGGAGFRCRELRDAGLTLRSPASVVGNDVDADGRHLVVITGANSGGKSTFLRSLGLAQLMFQAGMFVPALEFSSPVIPGLQTHFVRGETPASDTGRLDSDLARLAATVRNLPRGAMLLLNEPLSGTNEREGSEIARQVVEALVEAGVTVVLVTHFFQLAEELRLHPPGPTLHLRAERLEDGRRTYRIREGGPATTAFGQDLLRGLKTRLRS
ncbi:MAG: MutS-related protein [Candidatus Dormibacteria bacterium]